MKIVHVVGGRPQFIKVSMVDRELRRKGHESIILHTGQHYNYRMSQVFFDEMDIPETKINLEVGSGSHAEQTGKALIGIEQFLIQEEPDWVLVYGDMNATLSGALAACKLQIRSAHVEAGLRSYNRQMPEEFNRIVADHCVDIRFCPTETAQNNLAKEGITPGAYLPGDVMLDAVMYFNDGQTDILEKLEINPCTYLLMTVHRPTITKNDLEKVFLALKELDETVIFPCHPRFRSMLPAHSNKVRVIQPVGYLDMLTLEKYAKMSLTDSSGVQRESYYFGIPCLTLRTETELIETVIAGRNEVVGIDTEKIVRIVRSGVFSTSKPNIFGDGNAAKYIVRHLEYA